MSIGARLLRRLAGFAGGLLLLGLIAPQQAAAHDVPDAVRVIAFVKPEGKRLNFLVRVPLRAMRDVDVPRRGGGFLDFSRVDSALRDAATLWLGDEVELYEDGVRLGRPRVVDARVSLESDRSFTDYERALANFRAPRLANDTELTWNQGMLDVLLEYPIASERAAFAIRPVVDHCLVAHGRDLCQVGRADLRGSTELVGVPGDICGHVLVSWK